MILLLPRRRRASDYFGKTLPFSFRCRWFGLDLQGWCSVERRTHKQATSAGAYLGPY